MRNHEPHAASAAARLEKTRGRRRISRKAPDLTHDAVRSGARSDGRLHTGTTRWKATAPHHMGRGSFGLSLKAHHPEARRERFLQDVILLFDNRPRRTRSRRRTVVTPERRRMNRGRDAG